MKVNNYFKSSGMFSRYFSLILAVSVTLGLLASCDKKAKVVEITELNVATTKDEVSTVAGESSESEDVEFPPTMNLNDAYELVKSDSSIQLIDVRTPEEYVSGHLPLAKLLPLTDIQEGIGSMVEAKDTKIIVYCRSGNRSAKATQILKEAGYKYVSDAGGITSYSGKLEK